MESPPYRGGTAREELEQRGRTLLGGRQGEGEGVRTMTGLSVAILTLAGTAARRVALGIAIALVTATAASALYPTEFRSLPACSSGTSPKRCFTNADCTQSFSCNFNGSVDSFGRGECRKSDGTPLCVSPPGPTSPKDTRIQ